MPGLRAEHHGRRANRYVPRVTEPARWGFRRQLLDQLDRLHLARPTVRLYELALATKSDLRRSPSAEDGLPLPPARLRVQVGPLHADPDFFLESGRQQAKLIESRGGKLLFSYVTLGRFDVVLVFEAPSDEVATGIMLNIAEQGAFLTETMRAYSPEPNGKRLLVRYTRLHDAKHSASS